MKVMSETLTRLIAQEHVSAFLLINIGPFIGGEKILSCTLPYDFTFNGELYHSDARIATIDLPKISSPVDREAYKVSINDPTMDYRFMIENGVSGVKIKAWSGFINTFDETVDGIPPGAPFTQVENAFMLYSGILDTQMYTISTDSEIILNFEGASPMGPLGLRRTLVTSKDWMAQNYPGDTSYNQIYVGSADQILLWGKKPPGT